MMDKLLILEDDRPMNLALKLYFEKAGYVVYPAFRVSEAAQILEKADVDLLIADIGLPGRSGLDFVRGLLKERKMPVLFLTARDEEQDILNGYEAGCEEYVVKPISPKILLKKTEAILRRNRGGENLFLYQDLKIDYDSRRVWKESEEIHLTAREWSLLNLLSRNRGRIVTREMILQKVWELDGDFVGEDVVKVGINRLRKKLGEGEYIKNVFGVGYTFGE